MSIGKNIKNRRQQLKLSQEYVADQLGISRQAVAKWEAGNSDPTAANLVELAALFEMSVSELVDPQKYAEEKREQEQETETKVKNSKMFLGRWGAICLITAGWDGYSSGLYDVGFPYYWLGILTVGFILLFITSRDMNKKHKLEPLQILIGILLIFSIFFMPRVFPFEEKGINYLVSNIATAVCVCILSLKYWRHIWPVK